MGRAMSFWECLPHLLRMMKFCSSSEAAASQLENSPGREETAKETPRQIRGASRYCGCTDQCFLEVPVVPEVDVVPEVVVEVVPEVDVAVVAVVAEVSVIVPLGIAEVDVEPIVEAVSVAIVPVVEAVSVAIVDAVSVAIVDAVSVLLLFVSLLQAKPKTLSARTVRRTRSFLLMLFFSSRNCVGRKNQG